MTIPVDALKHFTIENYLTSNIDALVSINSELRCDEPLHDNIIIGVGADLDQIVELALEHWKMHEEEE